MEETIEVTGVVCVSAPAGEYDRRLVIITRELGKITVFASGARRPTCPYLAACRTFTFASFTLLQSRSFYRLKEAKIVESFEALALDFEGAMLGSYFLELGAYFSEENLPAEDMVNLLFVALKAVIKKQLDIKLIRAVLELRVLVTEGEGPQVFNCCNCNKGLRDGFLDLKRHGISCKSCCHDGELYLSEGAVAALQYIETAPVSRLFAFSVNDEVKQRITEAVGSYYKKYVTHKFKSLELLGD